MLAIEGIAGTVADTAAARAGELGGDPAAQWASLGEVEYRQGRHHAALALLNRAIARRPAKAAYLVLRGQVWLALEKWSEAERDFDRVGLLDPGNPERLTGLYETYLGQLDARRILGFLPLAPGGILRILGRIKPRARPCPGPPSAPDLQLALFGLAETGGHSCE